MAEWKTKGPCWREWCFFMLRISEFYQTRVYFNNGYSQYLRDQCMDILQFDQVPVPPHCCLMKLIELYTGSVSCDFSQLKKWKKKTKSVILPVWKPNFITFSKVRVYYFPVLEGISSQPLSFRTGTWEVSFFLCLVGISMTWEGRIELPILAFPSQGLLCWFTSTMRQATLR